LHGHPRPPRPDLHFGPYRLDRLNGLLWRGPRIIPLSPKATAVLWQLACRAGQLVTKAELFQMLGVEFAEASVAAGLPTAPDTVADVTYRGGRNKNCACSSSSVRH
jgi:hypothetical protein